MRHSWASGALVAMVLLGGCSLHKDNNGCATEPGLANGGSTVCTKPGPTDFHELGK